MASTGKRRTANNARVRTRPSRAYLPAAERRKSIIAAAQQVFARANLQGARTRDIAKAADVNQATLFEHFDSKKALFHEAVVRPLIEAMRGAHARVEAYETAATPADLARLAQASGARHLRDMIEIFPLLTVALFSEPELGRKLYREEVAPLIRQRGEVLRPLVKEGIDPQLVGLFNFGMLFALAMDRYLGGGQGELSVLASQLTRFATQGFARERIARERMKGPTGGRR
ncbi:MAG TPA: helix-turn-helix domain-containing protein [Steroidobacteraceae bacterium]|nr:helix-turn-helix domain-containing protein [Steroidobacteraceae bacterium]